MLIYSKTLTRADLERVCAAMPIKLWENDSEFSGPRRRRFRTMIRPTPLGTAGDRWRKISEFNGRPRRSFACSWGAHYVFFSALLELDPEAEFKSSLAHWKGREDFHRRAPSTGQRNWGSIMHPQYADEMCATPMSVEAMRELACQIAGTEYAPERLIEFSTVHPDGTFSNVRHLRQATIMACPHFIMVPEHYRENGSCKCDDRAENIMAEWEYTWDESLGRWN